MNVLVTGRPLGRLSLRAKALLATLVAVAVSTALVVGAAPARADEISTIRILTTGACIDIDPNTNLYVSDSSVYLAPCDGSNTQNWQIARAPWANNDGTWYWIVNEATGQCMTPLDFVMESTSGVFAGPCDGDAGTTPGWQLQGMFGTLIAAPEGRWLTDNGQGGVIVTPHGSVPGASATWLTTPPIG
ncbi:ricin-type beta-trefoil lectin protein [Jatrophihabitans sp. GAS493]|nr:ricin-type beta-trefoil lectin protein [Jatrophihabitans sp. GAS493]